MTADEVKIAATTSFYQFCRQKNIDPSTVTEPMKMAWQAAFVEGAHWMKDRCSDDVEAVLKEVEATHRRTKGLP